MPRTDIEIKRLHELDMPEWDIRRQFARIQNSKGGKKVLIVHPTKARENIAWSGRLRMVGRKLFISLIEVPSTYNQYHRGLKAIPFECELSNNRFILATKSESRLNRLSDTLPDLQSILATTLQLTNKAIETKQLKLGRAATEISFLTWKDNPQLLELYDLREFRDMPIKQVRDILSNKKKKI